MTTPARLGQFAFLALALAAIVFVFSPHEYQQGKVTEPGRRLPMPDFTMPDLQGSQWKLSEHRGRVVLVNFWATWCGPCREEIPGFMRLVKTRDNLDIAGIAMDPGEYEVRQFVTAAKLNYPVLLPPASWPLADSIEGLPTSFLVDKQGRIARQYIGAYSEKTMRADVDRLLTEP